MNFCFCYGRIGFETDISKLFMHILIRKNKIYPQNTNNHSCILRGLYSFLFHPRQIKHPPASTATPNITLMTIDAIDVQFIWSQKVTIDTGRLVNNFPVFNWWLSHPCKQYLCWGTEEVILLLLINDLSLSELFIFRSGLPRVEALIIISSVSWSGFRCSIAKSFLANYLYLNV